MTRALVVVYSKIPGCGPAKTRLHAALTARGATRFLRACVLDTLAAMTHVDGVDVELAYAPPARRSDALALVSARRVRCVRQYGRTLGDRLEHTIAHARARGYARIVVIGSDSPTMPRTRIADAFRALDRAQCAIGPADDGGFYLIASRITLPRGVLGEVGWSSGRERADVERALRARGVRLARIAPWYDIDRPKDCARALRDARHMRAAPRTRRFLECLQRV